MQKSPSDTPPAVCATQGGRLHASRGLPGVVPARSPARWSPGDLHDQQTSASPGREGGFTLIELLVVMAVGLLMTTSFALTFSYLASATAQSIAGQNATAGVRLTMAQLSQDISEANPLVDLSSSSSYADSVEMALGPSGSQQVVRWVLQPVPGSAYGTLYRQVMSGTGSSATVLSSYPEVTQVANMAEGIPVFDYYGQGGENLVVNGAAADQTASCSVRVGVTLVVDPSRGADPFTERSETALSNTEPGSMPCG